MRLNQYIALAGITSRRGADALIGKGSVKVNNKVVSVLGTQIHPSKDSVAVFHNDSWHTIEPEKDVVIYAVYKPRGYVTSLRKQSSSPVVAKLVPQQPRVFPVGRLDKDSEGLLLMTNDGYFAHKLTHPRTHITKTYRVHCHVPRRYDENRLKSQLGRIAKGVRIDGKRTMPASIELKGFLRPSYADIEIVLREGRNRQIRRMLGRIHLTVDRLIRTKIGNLSLDELNLEQGKYVRVEKREILGDAKQAG